MEIFSSSLSFNVQTFFSVSSELFLNVRLSVRYAETNSLRLWTLNTVTSILVEANVRSPSKIIPPGNVILLKFPNSLNAPVEIFWIVSGIMISSRSLQPENPLLPIPFTSFGETNSIFVALFSGLFSVPGWILKLRPPYINWSTIIYCFSTASTQEMVCSVPSIVYLI